MPFLSGDDMPAPTYAVALFLTILGGASMAFHADASRTGTWAHVADRYGMFMPFAFLSVAVFNGLFHAYHGIEAVSVVAPHELKHSLTQRAPHVSPAHSCSQRRVLTVLCVCVCCSRLAPSAAC